MLPGPRVTVLTPTYNRPAYLGEAIRSVLAQQFADWEMLVVNDGGQDVREVVEGVRDPRVSYLNLPANRGKAACLNLGLEWASGQYVAYLDDDDVWYPNHLKVLVEALEANPDVGVAYSDLYAVVFARGEGGRRYPLEKRIWVCRDYNRMLMFHFNHVLHVSMMHRKELALRAGGYDETIRVMIDWDMTRKLSFYTDFLHVPVTTGEYYQPVQDSDRISDRGRRDEEAYRHNLRRVRADLPPEPWPKVKRTAVVAAFDAWDARTAALVRYFADKLDHPCRIVLVNRDAALSPEACRASLGRLAELGHVTVVDAGACDLHGAYLAGVRAVEADFCYLASPALEPALNLRLIRGLGYMDSVGAQAVRWYGDPTGGPYDVLATRRAVLDARPPGREGAWLQPVTVPEDWQPEEFEADHLIWFARECEREGSYALAKELLERAAAVRQGGTGDPFLVQLYANVAFELGDYEAAERMCRRLVAEGYGKDNWVRLGCIHQGRRQWREALEAYARGLAEIGLAGEDLEGPPFPLFDVNDSDAFRAVAGQGECLLALGEDGAAAGMLRKAIRLQARNHRPYVALARLMARRDRPREALGLLATAERQERPAQDLSVEDVYIAVHERLGDLREAFEWCLKGLERRPEHGGLLARAARLGALLGEDARLAGVHERFLARRPGNVAALGGLAAVYRRLGRVQEAEGLASRAALLSADQDPGRASARPA